MRFEEAFQGWTAAAAGLASHHACGLLSRLPASVAHTWAYVLAAAILYIPANVMPVMTSDSLFGEQDDTILSGVWFLWQDGSWFLAALVFFASIVVPLAKLAALAWLLAGVQLRWAGQPLWRARVYRTIEFLGRWSMLDIYVVTLLAGLVQVQSLAAIHAGPGAVAFGAAVVLTMLASRSFDPRLIRDAQAAARQLQPAGSPRPIET